MRQHRSCRQNYAYSARSRQPTQMRDAARAGGLKRVAHGAGELPLETARLVIERYVPRDSRFGQRGQHCVTEAVARGLLDRRAAVLLPGYREHIIIAAPGDGD